MPHEFELYSLRSRQTGMDRRGQGRTYFVIDGPQRRRFDVRVERRAAILHEIEKRSSDPALSAITVANVLGVTARYVHLLLEETGASFSHHVLDRRLERAASLLRDPQWRDRLIIEIAAEAGFTDISHFNRAFRRKFRATPSVIRKSSGRDEKLER
jgi:AraC-like DNA-binding protein